MSGDGSYRSTGGSSGYLPSSEIVVYVPFVGGWHTMCIMYTGEVEKRMIGESITPVWCAFVESITRLDTERDD